MATKPLRSAGVVPYVTDPEGGRRYLLLQHVPSRGTSGEGHWDFPKGGVRAGESDRSAAQRELLEETGIRASRFIETFRREVDYVFRDGPTVYRKSVLFLLAEVEDDGVVLSDEHVRYAWLPYAEAYRRLTFATSREVLRCAEALLLAASETPSVR
jgi:8-oxo-dGTP pyrophosphatase MutT (NUDIX family)